MLRLNRQTDYGIMILTCLVREDDKAMPPRLLSAPEIATASGLALPNVSKILKALVRGGILQSRRGGSGWVSTFTTSRRDLDSANHYCAGRADFDDRLRR